MVNTVPSLGPVGGAALAAHPDVDKVAFTGSTMTGRKIMEAASKSNLKKVLLVPRGSIEYTRLSSYSFLWSLGASLHNLCLKVQIWIKVSCTSYFHIFLAFPRSSIGVRWDSLDNTTRCHRGPTDFQVPPHLASTYHSFHEHVLFEVLLGIDSAR